MALTAQSKIDNFGFLSLNGNPEALKRQVEMFARGGVDGVTVVRLGKRGVKFTLQSRVDMKDAREARAEYRRYLGLIGGDPVQLQWHHVPSTEDNPSDWTVDSTIESAKVAILDVRQVDIKRLAKSVGGLNPPGLGFLICDWDLVMIAY
jgi:hypothetical protein